MTDKKISLKKVDGKWWTYGSLKTNQWGNEQISFKLTALEELLDEAKKLNKDWVNLSLFDNDKPKQQSNGYQQHNEAKSNGYQPQEDDIEDNTPF